MRCFAYSNSNSSNQVGFNGTQSLSSHKNGRCQCAPMCCEVNLKAYSAASGQPFLLSGNVSNLTSLNTLLAMRFNSTTFSNGVSGSATSRQSCALSDGESLAIQR